MLYIWGAIQRLDTRKRSLEMYAQRRMDPVTVEWAELVKRIIILNKIIINPGLMEKN